MVRLLRMVQIRVSKRRKSMVMMLRMLVMMLVTKVVGS